MSRLKARPRRVLCWVLSFAMALQALPLLAFADPPTPAVAQYPPFLIGPGDMLSVTVYGEKDLPDKYLVDSTGAIELKAQESPVRLIQSASFASRASRTAT